MEAPYRSALARIHHEGFGFHAERCAPGILDLLEPVRGGLVVEIGCGSGLLTRRLTEAGHRVIATDASPDMLDLARWHAPDAIEHRLLRLPDDPLPGADAIVSIGHALSYLPDAASVARSLEVCAAALRDGGVLALDLEDVSLLDHQLRRPPSGFHGDDWALIVDRVSDGADHFARIHTIFVAEPDGRYRRETERHDNVLVDVEAVVPPLLAKAGLDVRIGDGFGREELMAGLKTVVATRPA